MADVVVQVIVSKVGSEGKAVTKTTYVPGDLFDNMSSRVLGLEHDQKQDAAQSKVSTIFVDAYRELVESDRT